MQRRLHSDNVLVIFALRVYLLRNNTKTKTCTTTLWSSKVENCIPKLMIMMLYRIYKRLRPRQCRQFSNVHGYYSKSTFRVLIKKKMLYIPLQFFCNRHLSRLPSTPTPVNLHGCLFMTIQCCMNAYTQIYGSQYCINTTNIRYVIYFYACHKSNVNIITSKCIMQRYAVVKWFYMCLMLVFF